MNFQLFTVGFEPSKGSRPRYASSYLYAERALRPLFALQDARRYAHFRDGLHDGMAAQGGCEFLTTRPSSFAGAKRRARLFERIDHGRDDLARSRLVVG